jgi:hypothetical protein
MSKYTNSIYTPDKSGRLGATVFGKAKSGPFEKMLGIPTNTMTDEQINRRSLFAALSRTWGTLSESQRTGWNNLAKDFPMTSKGITYVISGFSFFMMLNGNLQIIGEPINEDPPDITAPETLTAFAVQIVDTPGLEDITLTVTPAIDIADMLQVYATRILRPGRKVYEKDLYHIGNLDHTFVSGGSIKVMYLAKFGIMPGVGKKVGFRVKTTSIADGYTGIPRACTAIGAL